MTKQYLLWRIQPHATPPVLPQFQGMWGGPEASVTSSAASGAHTQGARPLALWWLVALLLQAVIWSLDRGERRKKSINNRKICEWSGYESEEQERRRRRRRTGWQCDECELKSTERCHSNKRNTVRRTQKQSERAKMWCKRSRLKQWSHASRNTLKYGGSDKILLRIHCFGANENGPEQRCWFATVTTTWSKKQQLHRRSAQYSSSIYELCIWYCYYVMVYKGNKRRWW